jgi:hypothetical protein
MVHPTRALVVWILSWPFLTGQLPVNTARMGPVTADRAAPTPSEFPPERLIAEAKAANRPEGNYKYAKHLTEMLVPRRTGDAYIDAFSGRLSKADLMARHNERSWIPESAVAQAFNDLMNQISEIHGQSGNPPQTDANVVHQLRITLSEVSAAFSTVNSHKSECLPSEAVNLMIQLLLHNGSLQGPCPPTPGPDGALVQHACADVDATLHIFRYSRSHSASDQRKVFDHLAGHFAM